jgi:DNA repair protein RadD
VDRNAAAQATALTVNLGRDDLEQLSRQLECPIAPLPNSGNSLRAHQIDLITEIDRALAAGERHFVVQAPTGFGKTIVGATLAKRNLDEGRRTLFTVPALELVNQTVEKFAAEGIRDVGVIQADHELTDWTRPVQIASVQTLMRRRQMPLADMVIIDEVHKKFDIYERWLAGPWSHLPVIGLTATPWTRGLGKLFSKLIIGATTQQLIDAGYLSKFKIFGPASPDLAGVRTVAGDYHEGDLSKAMDKESLVADVIDTWIARGEGRPTFCFAVNRVHAKHLQQKFIEAGVAAGYIDCFTDTDERREIARQFHASEIKVVCNVGVLTTGIDWDVRCIILARPTRSEILFVQMIGRGLRTAVGKADCLVLDHSDNHTRLGFVTDIHHDKLDDGKPRPKAEPKAIEKLPKPCPKCTFMKPPKTLACPSCGFTPQPKCEVVNQDGELIELVSRSTAKETTQQERIILHAELRHIANQRCYKPAGLPNSTRQSSVRFRPGPGMRDRPARHPLRRCRGSARSRSPSRSGGRHDHLQFDAACPDQGTRPRALARDPTCARHR